MTSSLDIILTRYRRRHLRAQLIAMRRQSISADTLTIYQNESHHRGLPLLARRNGTEFVWSSRNTKHFGRFAHALTGRAEFVAILDDDIIPGRRCLESYLSQCRELGAIIGGNGRIAHINPARDKLEFPIEVGSRPTAVEVDFVGHLWLFRREWLHAMFSIPPYTWDTGEDMHLCFAAKLLLGVKSFAGAQPERDYFADTTLNALAGDRFASYRVTPQSDRVAVEEYFLAQGLEFVNAN